MNIVKPELYIRTDASPSIGLGHLTRCVSLAETLKDYFLVSFFVNVESSQLVKEFKPFFCFHVIDDEQLFFNRLSSESVVVLDGYNFGIAFQRLVKASGAVLVCIDDMADHSFVADLIINHSPGVSISKYNALPSTRYALGLDYALLRPIFLACARIHRFKPRVPKSVLICFGGADPLKFTLKVLQAIRRFDVFEKIVVVVGRAYMFDEELKVAAGIDRRVLSHKALSAEQLASLMTDVDAAIVPSSTVALESLACGCVTVSGFVVENQRFIYEGLKASNAIIDAGKFEDVGGVIEKLLKDGQQTKTGLIDGHSGERLLNLFRAM